MTFRARSLLTLAANAGFVASGFPAWRRFRRARRNVADVQADVLRRILRSAGDAEYGRAKGFSDLSTPRDYVERVPVVTYDDLVPQVERLKRGEHFVLAGERVTMFEPTSGSAGAAKYVPYTAGLVAEFQEAIGTWIFDLYTHIPALFLGRAYWCVTPLAARERRTAGGIPVGFDDEGAYFGALRRWLLSLLLVVPREVALIDDRDDFQYTVLRFLLEADDLTLISAWSPTFLTSLLEPFEAWRERLAEDVEFGTLCPPGAMAVELRQRLAAGLTARPDRAAVVRRATPSDLWPRLRLVSAWADGTASEFVPALRSLWPHASFQPKGLLATEGVVTFPLVEAPAGSALAVTSHFFDFLADDGSVRLAHELNQGAVYTVNLTTSGGLYRYALGDRVEVVGYLDQVPLLRFLGRQGSIVDWFGEKLNEEHVRGVLADVFSDGRPSFLLLALERRPRPRYVLWYESPADLDGAAVSSALDEGLRTNHHYDGCRRLGQLAAPSACRIGPGSGTAAVVRRARDEGRREGDLKPALLDRRADWSDWFDYSE